MSEIKMTNFYEMLQCTQSIIIPKTVKTSDIFRSYIEHGKHSDRNVRPTLAAADHDRKKNTDSFHNEIEKLIS